MQIVIEIDENVFTRLFDNGVEDNEIAVNDVCEMAKAIRDGSLLPKGHGRLIDESVLIQEINDDIVGNFDSLEWWLSAAPTIIEADKEGGIRNEPRCKFNHNLRLRKLPL